MDPRLKGSWVPAPQVFLSPLPKSLKEQPGFSDLQTFYPGIGVLCHMKTAPEEELWLDHSYRVASVKSADTMKKSGLVNIQIEKNTRESGVEIQDISGFRKITHLLDPVRWLQCKYSLPRHSFLPWHQTSWEATWHKLQDPMNQAYVDALASYAFSKLREQDISPHFHLYYGSLCGKAENYAYNITDCYMSYRHARWFWTSQEKGLFKLTFDESIPQEVKDAILQQPEELEDSSDEEDTNSEEELKGLECDVTDTNSLHSAGDSAFESASEDDDSEQTDTSHTDDDEDLEIYAECHNFPVMIIYTEASTGTMDDLLDDEDEVGCEPGTKQWENTWKAWIFQILAALSVGQTIFGFTHNDLHSNNIVWTRTNEPYLYYKMNDDTLFRVPTFGKIFRIIDFGRSIFRINDHLFYSDDFKTGNDAAEQFNFGDLYDASEPEVYPNPSFDLCRFTVSVLESLFPESPPVKEDAKILSQEPDLIIHETTSELYNTMWTWLLCDDGHNVLMDPDGTERYPSFDLYKVITQQVHNAVPADQFKKPLFEDFRVKQAKNKKVYSLYC